MKFVKMHGLGNDFVFFGGEDARRVEENGPAALAQKLCQKHFGVCADGLVLILPSQTARYSFQKVPSSFCFHSRAAAI